MKAFVMKEIGAVGMMEKPAPIPGPNEVADQKLEDVVKVLIRF